MDEDPLGEQVERLIKARLAKYQKATQSSRLDSEQKSRSPLLAKEVLEVESILKGLKHGN